MRWLSKWWHKRQRDIDVQILWPSCRDNASDIYQARGAFAAHAFNDSAWLELGVPEITRIILELN